MSILIKFNKKILTKSGILKTLTSSILFIENFELQITFKTRESL